MNAPASRATESTLPSVDYGALPRVREVEGVDALNLATHGCLQGSEPIVLRGLVAHWPETGMDSSDLLRHLAQGAADRPMPFYTAPAEAGGRVFYNDSFTGFNFERRTGRLRDCCEWLAHNADDPEAGMLYVGSTAVDGWLPDFSRTHPLDLGVENSICSLWLGTRARVAAHYDFPRNLACVVSGERRFTLFPPDAVGDLHIGPLERTPSGQPISLVDFHAIDEERFPRFSSALERASVAELAPGDALFMPGMWWHHVEALSTVNLLINYWWRDSAMHLGSPQMALLHAALSIGQLSDEERAPWRSLFEHLVLGRQEDDWSHLPEAARGVLGEVSESDAQALRRIIAQQLQH